MMNVTLMTIDAVIEAVVSGRLDVEEAVALVAAWPVTQRRAAREPLADLIAGERPGMTAALLRRLDLDGGR